MLELNLEMGAGVLKSRDLKLSLALIAMGLVGSLGLQTACSKSQPPQTHTPVAETKPSEPVALSDDSAPSDYALHIPLNVGKWTGDWEEIKQHNALRLLVVYNKSGYFYDKGRPRGYVADMANELQTYLNKQLKTKTKKFEVAVVPVAPSLLQKYLEEGRGDVIASVVIMTPEREKLVDFTVPMATNTRLIVTTNRNAPAINSLEDLAGKKIYANPLSVAYASLQELSQKFKQTGKAEIQVKASDPNLTEEDLLEMTNAGLIPATVTFGFRAKMWAPVLPDLLVHDNVVIKDNGTVAWALRKNSPQLKAILDTFLEDHKVGTVFGNIMMKRYYKDSKFVKNSTSSAEMKKFLEYVKYFKQYGEEYDFDYMMLAAQGYQESMLEQNRVSPRGAVGVMQVMPKYAAAAPINIKDVKSVDGNIHAGAKMLAQITKTYFNDPAITPVTKTLFTFAAYNAGPNRIVRLRKEAAANGLDPNKWFGNVEIAVANDIGHETVDYVSNIYKYYVAYKMTQEQMNVRNQAKQAAGK